MLLLGGLELLLFDLGAQSLHLVLTLSDSLLKLNDLLLLHLNSGLAFGHLFLELLFEAAHQGSQHGVSTGFNFQGSV